MAKTTIRQVEVEDAVDIFHWLHHYAFQPTLPFPEKEKQHNDSNNAKELHTRHYSKMMNPSLPSPARR